MQLGGAEVWANAYWRGGTGVDATGSKVGGCEEKHEPGGNPGGTWHVADKRQMGPSAVAFVEEVRRGKKRVGIVGVQAEPNGV